MGHAGALGGWRGLLVIGRSVLRLIVADSLIPVDAVCRSGDCVIGTETFFIPMRSLLIWSSSVLRSLDVERWFDVDGSGGGLGRTRRLNRKPIPSGGFGLSSWRRKVDCWKFLISDGGGATFLSED